MATKQEFNLLGASIGCRSPNFSIAFAFEPLGSFILVLRLLPAGISFVTLPSAIITFALKLALPASLVGFAVTTVISFLGTFMCLVACLLAMVARATKCT
jgi:hypothetical protein